MAKQYDATNDYYGYLRVVSTTSGEEPQAVVFCTACGNKQMTVHLGDLVSGMFSSCGCVDKVSEEESAAARKEAWLREQSMGKNE